MQTNQNSTPSNAVVTDQLIEYALLMHNFEDLERKSLDIPNLFLKKVDHLNLPCYDKLRETLRPKVKAAFETFVSNLHEINQEIKKVGYPDLTAYGKSKKDTKMLINFTIITKKFADSQEDNQDMETNEDTDDESITSDSPPPRPANPPPVNA
jgi:hypothetical protein